MFVSVWYCHAAIGYLAIAGTRSLQALCRRPVAGGDSVTSEIRIANDISEIARVADLVDSFGAGNQLPNEVVFALNVSLDEILNNIISYGYEDAGPHEILVRLELRSGIVDVVVEDDGKPFDPLLAPAPDLNAKLRLGGRRAAFRAQSDGRAGICASRRH